MKRLAAAALLATAATATACVHRPRFVRLGYRWSDRYDPVANTRVALDLYREQGTRPWVVS